MPKLSHLLDYSILDEESEAAKEAKRLGLIYGGWGKWKDSSGKTVAKTADELKQIAYKLRRINNADQDKQDLINSIMQRLVNLE